MSEFLPLRPMMPMAGRMPVRERGPGRENLHSYDERPTPLRRPFNVHRRRKSGIGGLLAGAALRALLVVALPVAVVVWLLYSPTSYPRGQGRRGARVSAD